MNIPIFIMNVMTNGPGGGASNVRVTAKYSTDFTLIRCLVRLVERGNRRLHETPLAAAVRDPVGAAGDAGRLEDEFGRVRGGGPVAAEAEAVHVAPPPVLAGRAQKVSRGWDCGLCEHATADDFQVIFTFF